MESITIEYLPRLSIHHVPVEYLELKPTSINFWSLGTIGFCGRKTNSPTLKIKFKDGTWFASPKGMVLNSYHVIKFLKKHCEKI